MKIVTTISFLLLFLSIVIFLFTLLHRPARQFLLFSFRLPRNWLQEIGIGLLIVLLPFLCWIGFSYFGNSVELTFQNFQAPSFLKKAGEIFLYAALEEVVCRAILLSLLLYLIKKEWITLLISSLIFGGLHASNSGADLLSLLSNSLGGLIYGFAFIRTQSLLLPVMLHFCWNAVQGPLMGISVSGAEQQGVFRTTITGGSPWFNAEYGVEGGITGIMLRLLVLSLLLTYLLRVEKRNQLPQKAL